MIKSLLSTNCHHIFQNKILNCKILSIKKASQNGRLCLKKIVCIKALLHLPRSILFYLLEDQILLHHLRELRR